ncbi:MAG: hypothetical protein KUL74_03735 [Cloacibacterium sp.]|nr:hypothetical protein [Cloacibacterium sp.]
MSVFVSQNKVFSDFKNSESWVILSTLEKQIKEKIERIGKPLKDWDISINYGIKTGYNDAFIITGEKRKELIKQDPKSEEIIRPILRGRDIKRYGYAFADLWLINSHNGIKEKGIKPINIEDYPAIKKHLDSFSPLLEKRTDKGDTKYNLRNCVYMDEFSKQKIMYKDITERLSFCLVNEEIYCNNTVYFMTSTSIDLEYILDVLNSPLIDWYYRTLSVQLGELAVRMFSIYVLNIPIPLIEEYKEDIFKTFNLSAEERDFILSKYDSY